MFRMLNFLLIPLLLLTPCALAQSIFDQPANKPSQPSGPMSANDFKNTVNQLSQQTNSGLNQQAKQLYPNTQPNTQPASTPTTQTTGDQPPAKPTTVDNPFSVDSGAAPKPQPGNTTPSQPEGYTGFGGTKSNKSNPPASSGSSGGWNINY